MSESKSKIRPESLKKSKNIICFRNPKKRTISLFLDKIVNNCYDDENSTRILNKINKDWSKVRLIDFLSFIHDNKKSLNKLWKDQCSYILFNHYDYIFNTDTLEQDWNLCQLYKFLYHSTSQKKRIQDIDVDSSILELKKIQEDYSIPHELFFTKNIEELFNQIYKDDIILYRTFFGEENDKK